MTTLEYDVVVVGAGAAGLRAAIEAAREGARTAVACKSLLGKAGTVISEDRVAAPVRRELLAWGALLDSTQRTGLEVLRVLQSQVGARGIDVHMECDVKRLVVSGSRIAGAFGYRRATGEFVLLRCGAVVLATGGAGRLWKAGPADATGDGLALASSAGADSAVDARTAAATVPGLFAVGGLSLSGALASGRRGGFHAARYCRASKRAAVIDVSAIEEHRRALLAPFQRTSGESPYALLHELQDCMSRSVSIARIADLRSRWRNVAVSGGLVYNPAWHLALELDSMLLVAETVLASPERNWRKTWLANRRRSESGVATTAAAVSKNIA
jgi:succinate dehydrogenase/fumarate reductase flavoprotein subunit